MLNSLNSVRKPHLAPVRSRNTKLDQLLESERRDPVKSLHLAGKVRVVAKTEILSDFVEIFPLQNQSPGKNSTILSEKIFRIHAHGRVESNFKIANRHPEALSNAIHHKPFIVSNLEDISPVLINHMISSAVESTVDN